MVAVLGKILEADVNPDPSPAKRWTRYSFKIQHPEGTDWMSCFDVLATEMKVGDIYNIEYHTNDRGYKNLDKWEKTKFGDEVATTEVMHPRKLPYPPI